MHHREMPVSGFDAEEGSFRQSKGTASLGSPYAALLIHGNAHFRRGECYRPVVGRWHFSPRWDDAVAVADGVRAHLEEVPKMAPQKCCSSPR